MSLPAAAVDAVVSTIGLTLVIGPADSMAAGCFIDAAAAILFRLDVPYVIAVTLLIQDVPAWSLSGVSGLQAVMLYALPQQNGALDPAVLGRFAGDRTLLVFDRVTGHLRARLAAAAKPPAQRLVAVVLCGRPPGAGAGGTAARLYVPR